MKRLLEFDDDYDFSLLGISSHVKDYRLCWGINNALDIHLEKAEPLIMEIGGEGLEFPMHRCMEEEDHLSFVLLSNKVNSKHLIPEYPQLDYFLRISGPQHEYEADDIKNRIQDLDLVLTALMVDITKLRSKPNLVF